MHWIYLLHVSHNHFVGVYKENVLIRRAHLQIKCYFIPKKNKKHSFLFDIEIKSENISESQTNDQKNHVHVSSKHQGSQVETTKEDPTMGEGKLGYCQ